MTNKTEERIVVKMHLFDNTCQSDYTIDVIIPKWRMGCTPIGVMMLSRRLPSFTRIRISM